MERLIGILMLAGAIGIAFTQPWSSPCLLWAVGSAPLAGLLAAFGLVMTLGG